MNERVQKEMRELSDRLSEDHARVKLLVGAAAAENLLTDFQIKDCAEGLTLMRQIAAYLHSLSHGGYSVTQAEALRCSVPNCTRNPG